MLHSARNIAFVPSLQLPRIKVERRAVCSLITMSLLKGRNAVITGATRGIGRGLAIAFGEQGANVYITGRTRSGGPGSLESVAEQVRTAGGNCEYFVIDHSDDEQVARLFIDLKQRLASDGSTLDIFVNNAYAAVGFLKDTMEIPFWKKSVDNPATPDDESDPGKVWDLINGVGLRNNYVCSTRAIRMMEKQGSGVIVNISSWAGSISLFDPVYSIGKHAIDRMSAEIAQAAPEGVSCFTFCPGVVATEDILSVAREAEEQKETAEQETQETGESLPIWNAESPLFVGRVLSALVSEKGARLLPKMKGKIVIAAEVAEILDIYDENNFRCLSLRSVRYSLMNMIPFLRNSPLRYLIPRTLYAPWPLLRWAVGPVKHWN